MAFYICRCSYEKRWQTQQGFVSRVTFKRRLEQWASAECQEKEAIEKKDAKGKPAGAGAPKTAAKTARNRSWPSPVVNPKPKSCRFRASRPRLHASPSGRPPGSAPLRDALRGHQASRRELDRKGVRGNRAYCLSESSDANAYR